VLATIPVTKIGTSEPEFTIIFPACSQLVVGRDGWQYSLMIQVIFLVVIIKIQFFFSFDILVVVGNSREISSLIRKMGHSRPMLKKLMLLELSNFSHC